MTSPARPNGTFLSVVPVTGLFFSCGIIWIIMRTVSMTVPLWLTMGDGCVPCCPPIVRESFFVAIVD